jgi:hypothetical protein
VGGIAWCSDEAEIDVDNDVDVIGVVIVLGRILGSTALLTGSDASPSSA